MKLLSIDMKAKDGLGYCILILETRDTKQLLRVRKKVREIPNVINQNDQLPNLNDQSS